MKPDLLLIYQKSGADTLRLVRASDHMQYSVYSAAPTARCDRREVSHQALMLRGPLMDDFGATIRVPNRAAETADIPMLRAAESPHNVSVTRHRGMQPGQSDHTRTKCIATSPYACDYTRVFTRSPCSSVAGRKPVTFGVERLVGHMHTSPEADHVDNAQ